MLVADHSLTIPLAWQNFEQVHSTIRDTLCDEPDELKEAVTMVASELAENLVKYGVTTDQVSTGRLSMSFQLEQIVILSENAAAPEDATRVCETIDHAKSVEDPQEAFLERMRQLVTEPSNAHSRLGLLRILYEGRFELTCQYHEPLLTIEARRSLTR